MVSEALPLPPQMKSWFADRGTPNPSADEFRPYFLLPHTSEDNAGSKWICKDPLTVLNFFEQKIARAEFTTTDMDPNNNDALRAVKYLQEKLLSPNANEGGCNIPENGDYRPHYVECPREMCLTNAVTGSSFYNPLKKIPPSILLDSQPSTGICVCSIDRYGDAAQKAQGNHFALPQVDGWLQDIYQRTQLTQFVTQKKHTARHRKGL